jgi:hypothetical protein
MQTQSWGQVPDRSVLRVQVAGSDQNFTALGRIINPPRPLSHNELTAGISVPIRAPGTFDVEVNVFFNGAQATTITLVGGVSDPNNAQFGSPLNLGATGINGDHANFLVSALTAV